MLPSKHFSLYCSYLQSWGGTHRSDSLVCYNLLNVSGGEGWIFWSIVLCHSVLVRAPVFKIAPFIERGGL